MSRSGTFDQLGSSVANCTREEGEILELDASRNRRGGSEQILTYGSLLPVASMARQPVALSPVMRISGHVASSKATSKPAVVWTSNAAWTGL